MREKKLVEEDDFGPALSFAQRYVDQGGDLTSPWERNKEEKGPLGNATRGFETLGDKRCAVIEWNINSIDGGTVEWWINCGDRNLKQPSDPHFELIFHAATPDLVEVLKWINLIEPSESAKEGSGLAPVVN